MKNVVRGKCRLLWPMLVSALVLCGCSPEPIPVSNVTTEKDFIKRSTPMPEVSGAPVAIDGVEGLRDGLINDEDGTGVSLTTKGVRFDIASTDLVALSRVPPEIAAVVSADPEPAQEGRMNTYAGGTEFCYLALVDLTVTNLQDTPQAVYVNTLNIYADCLPYTDKTERMYFPISMRYFNLGDPEEGSYCRLELEAGESLDCVVGFEIDPDAMNTEEYPYLYYCLNPDGTYPPTDAARFADVKISYVEE